MRHPLLYELNTRCWLRELAEKTGRPVVLDRVPDSQFKTWQQLGFTHIWLLGIWPSGPLARARALGPQPPAAYAEVLPDWQPEDVAGSPYAIAEYRPALDLGGEAGLEKFRQTLHAHGLKLLLDFVPNHLGLDHPWVRERPGLFVQSAAPAPETFPVETPGGTRWLAHGKDPYFPAWSDTVQLDYRLPATRQAMIDVLLEVARRCDGVRCDMSMLLLNQVFARTWSRFPATGPTTEEEFWGPAIRAVKRAHPGFVFLAEAYWGLEPQLRALGFDYTYDKELYDKLMAGDPQAVQRHLVAQGPEGLERSAHFLENHDEPRVAARLSLPPHRAAALLVLGLPGMRFLHDGQLTGAQFRVPVQLQRRMREPERTDVKRMYEQILAALKATLVGRGNARLLSAEPVDNGCVFVQWRNQSPGFDLVAVNLTSHIQRCRVFPALEQPSPREWEIRDLLAAGGPPVSPLRLAGDVLEIELPGFAAQLLQFRPR